MKKHEILRALRHHNKLTLEEVAHSLGTTKQTIQRYETGAISNIPSDRIEKLAMIYNTSPSEIMGWTKKGVNQLHERENENQTMDLKIDIIPVSTKGISIPVLGKIVAGIPIHASEDILGNIVIEPRLANTGNFFALKVKGDSMVPDIYNNDIVIVRQQADVDSGDVAVVLVNNDEATVKRIKKLRNGIALIGTNTSAFEPMFFSEEEIISKPVVIIGKVVRAIKDF